MIEPDELSKLTISPEIAKQALSMAEQRLTDMTETGKRLDAKAQSLFSSFTALAVTLVGASAALTGGGLVLAKAGLPLVGAAFFLMFGAAFCAFALVPRQTGMLGLAPKQTLVESMIDATAKDTPLVIALMTHHYQERIDRTFETNAQKSRLVAWGAGCGLAAPAYALAIFAADQAGLIFWLT